MKKILGDYGLGQDTMLVHCDIQNAISISNNLVQHAWTKHIDIKYNFICDLVKSKTVALDFVPTHHQMAGLFTKSLDALWLKALWTTIVVCDPS
jgi:hypothetical protein